MLGCWTRAAGFDEPLVLAVWFFRVLGAVFLPGPAASGLFFLPRGLPGKGKENSKVRPSTRVGGATQAFQFLAQPLHGSSPHLRGNPGLWQGIAETHRVIPAPTGQPQHPAQPSHASTGHPYPCRACSCSADQLALHKIVLQDPVDDAGVGLQLGLSGRDLLRYPGGTE